MALDEALQEIMSSYLSRGMAGELGFGRRPAMLVVDFQKGLTESSRPAGCSLDEEIANTVLLLDRSRQKALPVFFFVIGYRHPHVEGGLLVKKLPVLTTFTIGSDNVELDPRLKPRPEEHVIVKKYASCFHGTHLASSLSILQVDTVLITGCITSGCIRATATDALQHGFRPVIPRECVGDRSRIPHEVNLVDIHVRCGDVLPLKRVLEYVDSL